MSGEQIRCAVCSRPISGEHPVTLKDYSARLKSGDFKSPPRSSEVHVCDERCAAASPDFQETRKAARKSGKGGKK